MNRNKTNRTEWRLSVALLGMTLGLSACTSYYPGSATSSPKKEAGQATPSAPNGLDAARKTLLGADLAFSRICEEQGSPEGFYQCMASNAICLLAGEPPIEGRDAIKIHLAAGPQGTLAWKPKEAEVGSNSDLGYTWGTCQFRGANANNQPQTTYGKYVIIWKKQTDGIWKASLYANSPNPPPSARR